MLLPEHQLQWMPVTVNVGQGAVRRVLNGRTYLVADATILVPGVLNGSQGALFYPVEEAKARPGSWNDIPLTLLHPFDPLTNEYLSARHKGVLDRQGLGFIRRDRWEDGKRRVKAWFDEELTKNKSQEVYSRLLQGKGIELSTGLYTDNIPSQGTFNGKRFDFVAVNYRPDHLAILPNQRGACSQQDGCGIFNAETANATSLRKESALALEGEPGAGHDCHCGGRCEDCQKKRVLTDNPAVSEAQRRKLNATFGHDWVKAHHFDNHGKLPETVGNSNPEGHNQYTDAANSASSKAEESGTRDSHLKAAKAHAKAANEHAKSAEDKTDMGVKAGMRAGPNQSKNPEEHAKVSSGFFAQAKAHNDQKAYHESKAAEHRAKAKGLTGNRLSLVEQLREIIANAEGDCKDDKT